MPDESASHWFLPFVAASAVAAACAGLLLTWHLVHRRERRRVLAALRPLGVDQGSLVMAARRAAAQAARQDAALAELRAVVEAAPFGIVALDRLGRVLTMNPAAGRMLGLSATQCNQRLLIEMVRAPELDALLGAAYETARPAEGELTFATGGARRVARAVAAPLPAASTEASCVVVLEELTELRRLESVRSDFVANVSHELRTPITSVRGYAETLLESFKLEPQARSFLEVIRRNTVRLGVIIDDLLLLSSLEGANADNPWEMTPVHVQEILREGIDQHSVSASDKEMTVECHCDPGLTVRGSAGLLAQAVGNLVENAVKYSPKKSVVRVEAHLEGDEIAIDVHDQGPGVPSHHVPRIFERFYRVDKARSRDSGGTGLGLAIVKHVAQSHGGSVEVESRTGGGSRFRLRLPAGPAPAKGLNAPNAHSA